MSTFDLALAVAATSVLVLTLASGWIKRRFWGSEALFCLGVGLLVGPQGLALFDLDPLVDATDGRVLEQAARLTLALSVTSAALSLPKDFLRLEWRALALILLPGMALMWMTVGAIAHLALGSGLLVALLLGAAVTPTDPVLARSIVTGPLAERHVPDRTIHLITAESGANDGLALPLVVLPLMLMDTDTGVASRSLSYLAWEVAGAIAVGWVLGKGTGYLFQRGHEAGLSEQKALTAITLALAWSALAAVALAGADGILGVFVAGLVFSRAVAKEHQEHHEHFQDAIDRSFTLPIFILLGIAIPLASWHEGSLPLLAAAIATVLLRRLPAWLLLQAIGRPYDGWRETLFAGWFGPIGVAALFYASFAVLHGAPDIVWSFVTLCVTLSLLVHGISGTPLTRLMKNAEREAGEQD